MVHLANLSSVLKFFYSLSPLVTGVYNDPLEKVCGPDLPDIFGLKTGNTTEKSLQTIKLSVNMLQDGILPLTSLLQGKHFNEK